MRALSRRLLLAGGAGAVGTAMVVDGAASAVGAQPPVAPADGGGIDLGAAPYGVVADVDDEVTALANTRAINQAISDHPSGARLVLPAGAVFVMRDPVVTGLHRFAAIRILGDKQRLALSGRGAELTRIVMTGSQSGGLSQIILVADGPTRITLCDFSIEHGPKVSNVDTVGLQNHQIEVNATGADVTDVEIRDVFFGTCVGDAIRLAGGIQDATPSSLRNLTIQRITMRLDKHPAAPGRCRSGVSFQKGIRDALLSDFHIVGPKNSPLDMEPTSDGALDNITITNGTIDNSEGDTFVAASFGGFEHKESHVTTFLSHSRMVNVRIKRGQLRLLSTRGCTLDNVVIDSGGPHPDGLDQPLLYVARENEDLAIRNVDIVRDGGSPAGPLVLIQHTNNSPKRVNIDGGTWTTRVGPGSDLAYVNLQDTTGLRMRGTRIRIEDVLTGTRFGVKCRPGRLDMANLHFDGVAIESPDGLTAGFAFAALNHNLTNIAITGCSLTGTATNVLAFDASSGVVDRFPIVQGNDFDRGGNLFSTDHAAVNAVFPIIAGNRGGQCTLTGAVDPEGTVAARQGSQYLRQNGTTSELWLKVTGAGPAGWKKLG